MTKKEKEKKPNPTKSASLLSSQYNSIKNHTNTIL